MRIAVLVPALAAHDAVSNDALGIGAALRRFGHEVAVFAPHARGVDEPVRPPGEIEAWLRSPRDVLLYHHCTAWDLALDLLRRVRARRVVRYHNVTPPEFFAGWSEAHVHACARGRAELDDYAALGAELYLGASPFNLEDFTRRGVDPARCAVLPPFHPVEALLAETAPSHRVPAANGATRLLMVGRIAPHKGDFTLIDVLAACRRAFDARAELLRIGALDASLAAYGDALRAHAAATGVETGVLALGGAGTADLRAAYASADALVVLSAHEGFCVPLVEAMALGLPVVACDAGAIAWTLGDAGIVWPERDPHLFAATVARLRADAELRDALAARGRARYREQFAPAALERGLRDALARLERVAARTEAA
ncbi:MAG TPA: glycosyltransferase [Dokdonella sp.]